MNKITKGFVITIVTLLLHLNFAVPQVSANESGIIVKSIISDRYSAVIGQDKGINISVDARQSDGRSLQAITLEGTDYINNINIEMQMKKQNDGTFTYFKESSIEEGPSDVLIISMKVIDSDGNKHTLYSDMGLPDQGDFTLLSYSITEKKAGIELESFYPDKKVARPGDIVTYYVKFKNLNNILNNDASLYLVNPVTLQKEKMKLIKQNTDNYIAKKVITQDTNEGLWKVDKIILNETADSIVLRNNIPYEGKQRYENATVEITKKRQDIYAPILDSLEVNDNKAFVDDIITFTLKAHDEDLSEIRDVTVAIEKDSSGTYDYLHMYKQENGDFTFNKYLLPSDIGKWKVSYVSLSDKLGNSALITNNRNWGRDLSNVDFSIEERQVTLPTTDQPATERPTTERPTTERPTTEQPTTERPTTERPTTERPTTEKPTTEQPATERPTTEKPTTERPITERPTTERPTTERPTTEKPVVKTATKPITNTKPAVNIIDDNDTKVSGKAKSGSTVYAVVNKKVIGQGTTKDGKFSFTIKKLPAGTQVQIYSVYKKVKSTVFTTAVIDKTLPAFTSLSAMTTKSQYVSGKGEKYASLTVIRNNKQIATGKVNSKSTFKVKVGVQKKGTTLTVYLKDKAGNASKKSVKVS